MVCMLKRWKMGERAIQSLASDESAWRRSSLKGRGRDRVGGRDWGEGEG